MQIIFSHHAKDRAKQFGLQEDWLAKVIRERVPPFKGLLEWRLSNNIYIVMSHQNGVIVIITVGRGGKSKSGQYRHSNRPVRK